jgi:hypothetical protein
MKHLHRVTERRGARRIAADSQCLLGSESRLWMMKQLTYSTWRSTKMMDDVPMSTLGLVVAGFMIDLGDSAPQAKALQGLVVAGFMIDFGDSAPQVKALQARILRKVEASAVKE